VRLGRPLIRLDSIPSTMVEVARLAAEGAPEGVTVVAEHQSAGRGRLDRRWETPPGTALLFSTLLRPSLPLDRLSPISLLVADAIATSVEEICGSPARIKWPNDVLIADRKLSGVLIQTRVGPGGDLAVVVGVGINVNIPRADLPPGATSLLAELAREVGREALLVGVLDRLGERYAALLEDDLSLWWPRIEERLALRGEIVAVIEGDSTVTGRVLGVDGTGALLLDVEGTTRRIVVGDVVRGPRRVDDPC
jgi:BirA family biotin operon repressor/biotin-[acetyl-CoA-carboxylase] ligase